MKTTHLVSLLQIASAVSVYIGFYLVTQAGQDMTMPQNDGYAMSGGLLILLGGLVFGTTLKYGYEPRKRK